VTVWVHWALSCPAGVPISEAAPECAWPPPVLPVDVQDQPVRPDSKPGLLIVFVSAEAGRTRNATAATTTAVTAIVGIPTDSNRPDLGIRQLLCETPVVIDATRRGK
jgi:hypothetical protein